MNTAEKAHLVSRFTKEVIQESELPELFEMDRPPRAYIGYAPTGQMHIGHFTTIRKLVDFIDAGIEVTVLIADLHAHLDDQKTPVDLLEARSDYYEAAVIAMLEAAGGDPRAVEFVRGSEYQLEPPYTRELYEMLAETTVARSQRAGSEVVRTEENPTLGGLVYSLMQSLDVGMLEADIAYGGIDQRGIYMLAREQLPESGYEKPLCVFAPLLSGLAGGKMSASDLESTINLSDPPAVIEEKVGAAYCPAGELEENGILEYLRYLVFPVLSEAGGSLDIHRPADYGGDESYVSYERVEQDFLTEALHPADLKPAVARTLAELLEPIRTALSATDLLEQAYPDRAE